MRPAVVAAILDCIECCHAYEWIRGKVPVLHKPVRKGLSRVPVMIACCKGKPMVTKGLQGFLDAFRGEVGQSLGSGKIEYSAGAVEGQLHVLPGHPSGGQAITVGVEVVGDRPGSMGTECQVSKINQPGPDLRSLRFGLSGEFFGCTLVGAALAFNLASVRGYEPIVPDSPAAPETCHAL